MVNLIEGQQQKTRATHHLNCFVHLIDSRID